MCQLKIKQFNVTDITHNPQRELFKECINQEGFKGLKNQIRTSIFHPSANTEQSFVGGLRLTFCRFKEEYTHFF
jgi:hypothetical protein